MGFGVWVRDWVAFKLFTVYSCANVMYREMGAQRLTGEGTAIMACRPISAVVILIYIDQGGRREG